MIIESMLLKFKRGAMFRISKTRHAEQLDRTSSHLELLSDHVIHYGGYRDEKDNKVI